MSVYPVDPVSPSEILARLPASFAKAKQDKDIFHFDSTTKVVPGAQNVSLRLAHLTTVQCNHLPCSRGEDEGSRGTPIAE